MSKYFNSLAHVKQMLSHEQKCTYTLVLVPRLSKLISRILDEEGVISDFSVISLPLYFIPLEEDLVSLENDNVFRQIWVVCRGLVHFWDAPIYFSGW